MEVNGKVYPMWSQFVEKKDQFIGGILEDLEYRTLRTEITDIELNPNGKESAFFEVSGKDFECGFDIKYGGLCKGEEGWITFSGYGGHTWRIKPKA